MDQKRYYRVVNNKNNGINKKQEKNNNNNNNSNSSWSPISDLKLPQQLANGDQDVQTQIDNVLHGPKTTARLLVFKQICPDQN